MMFTSVILFMSQKHFFEQTQHPENHLLAVIQLHNNYTVIQSISN